MKKADETQIAWYCLNYLPSISGSSEDGSFIAVHIDFGCRQCKYQVNPDVPNMDQWGNDVSWFRLAEAYYTAAECILRGAVSAKHNAVDLVNAVRSRSIPTPITEADLRSTVSKVKYGYCTYGDIKQSDLDSYGISHDWDKDGRAAQLEASQVAVPSGRDNDPITLAGMYDEWGFEFALEGLRRQQMIRFGTFSTRNWYNHHADDDDSKSIFPIAKSDQQDNDNLGQNPGYGSANGKMAVDVVIDDPITDDM